MEVGGIKTVGLVGLCALLMFGGLSAREPASADVPSDPSTVEEAIDVAAGFPETGPLDDAATFERESSGELVHSTNITRVSILPGDSPLVALGLQGADTLAIDANLPGVAEIGETGTAVFSSDEGYSIAPLPHDDGSVQIVTVIEDAGAPREYSYSFKTQGKASLEQQEDGSILILDSKGDYEGGVLAPWAYDSDGLAVPTHFVVEGDVLTQVVDHTAATYAYPITADPHAGKKLFQWVVPDRKEGDIMISLQPTGYGRGVTPNIMIEHGWPEALATSSSVRGYLLSKATMRQQFDCHAFGNAFAGVWNLERFRPNRFGGVWVTGVAIHRCNWTTPAGL